MTRYFIVAPVGLFAASMVVADDVRAFWTQVSKVIPGPAAGGYVGAFGPSNVSQVGAVGVPGLGA